MKKRILGISGFYHDSSASLLIDGEICGAVHEERFSRIKHDKTFPVNSIKYLLKNNNLSLLDIDFIVFYEKPFLKFERLLETYIAFAPKGFKSFCASLTIWLREKLFQKKVIFENLKKIDKNFKDQAKIKFSEHHLSHAASAFFPSPYERAIILTMDGVGEWATTTIGEGYKNKLKIFKEIHFPHSLGLLYSAFTYYLGFKVNSGEYKVMGLAPYGKPIFKELILNKLIDVKNDGSFRLKMKYFNYATGLTMTNSNFDKLFGNKRRSPETEKLNQFHMNIASSLQAALEEIILKICNNLKKEFNIDNLCLAGGVALNCVANGKIQKSNIFKNIWIQPASGDAGGSLGACLFYWHEILNMPKTNINHDIMKGSFLGPEFENNEIEDQLKKCGAKYKKYNIKELILNTASMLNNGKIIGLFQGRSEFGPRALGNRSIIADPRIKDLQKNLNLKIKFRESFRPFAPAILSEKLSEYFKLTTKSPYMLLVSEINDDKKLQINNNQKNLFGISQLNLERSTVPAITHVDYSSRIQTIHKETNEFFYKVVKEFENISDCPMVVNTSFNIRGEPMVNSPTDAFKCFMGTELDALVIGEFILIKDDQNPKNIINYKNQFELD